MPQTTTPSTAPTAWDIVKLARHPERALFLDYVHALFSDVDFLSGDRLFGDDLALLGGTARFMGKPVVFLGHQKGHNTTDRITRNFGMPSPEGYRKAQRLAHMAEQFNLPLICFIDTPGAYPGKEAEERGQAEAIAQCLATFAMLKVPIINIVIGEGGSGGALAVGVGDHAIMLSNAIYSVISPEGCASILWKTSDKAMQASEALGLTAPRLLALKLIDHVIDEGAGAHVDLQPTISQLQHCISQQLATLQPLDSETLCQQRYQRLMQYDHLHCLTP